MSYVKEFTRFFHTRSDSNADEVRAYLSGLMQAKRGAKNLERMLEQRIEKRLKDPVRRRIKTRATRPPLWPDEISPK